MPKIKTITKVAVSASMLAAVAGCTSIDEVHDDVAEETQNASKEIAKSRALQMTSVEEVNDIWLGGNPFMVSEVEKLPEILKREVSVKQLIPVSVFDLLSDLSRDLGVRITLSSDAEKYLRSLSEGSGKDDKSGQGGGKSEKETYSIAGGSVKFDVNFVGKAYGLMDMIAARTGLFWRFENGEIIFRRHETKVYMVDAAPGSVMFEGVIKSDLSSAAGGGSGGDEGALSSSESYHMTKTEIKPKKPVDALVEGLSGIVEDASSITIDDTIGAIIVTETPSIHKRVAEYVKRFNAIAGKTIAIKADVMEITSDDNGNFDTAITGLFNWGGEFTLGFDGGSKLSIGLASGGAPMANKWSGDSQATLDLLKQNKNVSLVTSSMMYTTNGQPVPFQQLNEVGYLQEVTMESSSSDEEAAPNMALKPGRTSQGFSMTILPRVTSTGSVMMNIAVDSSLINSIDEYGIEGGAKLQLPNRSMNKYQQLVTIASGKPLMIAGLERTEKHSNIKSRVGRSLWFLGGSQNGGNRKIITMIMLTPYVMAR